MRLNSERAGSDWVTVVGVVGDVKNPVGERWQPTAYRPFAQTPYSGATLLVALWLPTPRRWRLPFAGSCAPSTPPRPEIRIVASLDAAVRDYVSPQRFTTTLLAIFGAIGLAGCGGIYGVMRLLGGSGPRIGIRMALGAQRTMCSGWCSDGRSPHHWLELSSAWRGRRRFES